VKHDHRLDVRHNESNRIRGSQSTSVGGSQSIDVGSDQAEHVGKNRTVKVGGDDFLEVAKNRKVTIDQSDLLTISNGDETVNVVAGNYLVSVPGGVLTLQAGSAHVTITNQRIELLSGAGAKVMLLGENLYLEGTEVHIKASRLARIHSDASVEIDANRVAIDGHVVTDVRGGVLHLNRAPVVTGLGADVDALANQSPTLQADLARLQRDGWRIVYGTPGGGSFTTRPNTITIDGALRGNPQAVVQALSHETGHARYTPEPQVPMTGLTRDQYVSQNTQRDLRDEGAATLENARVRDELRQTSGSDVGIAGTRPNDYQQIYEQRQSGAITEEQARDQIGTIYGQNETTSNSHQNSHDYYSQQYGDAWDHAHPNGGGSHP
jgi:type VI secretion system secreted protein VgrG